MRARQSGEAAVLLDHEAAGGDCDVLVVGLRGHHLLEGVLVRRLGGIGPSRGQLVERQQVDRHAVGHLAGTAALDLA